MDVGRCKVFRVQPVKGEVLPGTEGMRLSVILFPELSAKEHEIMKESSKLMCLAVVVTVLACGVPSNAGVPSTPDGTVMYVSQQLGNGHPEILWEALPAGYQNDVSSLTHDFATKMDAEVWNRSFAVMAKAVNLLKDKKELFFQTRFFDMAGDKKDKIAENWDTGTTFLDTVLKSDVSKLERLQTIDWEQFLSTTGAQLMQVMKSASAATEEDSYKNEFLAKLQGLKVEVKNSGADMATVVLTAPDEEPEEIVLTRIEGRWVPKDLSEDWKKKMTEARAKVDALTPETMAQQKMQFMMFLGMAEGMIDQLAQAQSPEQLEQMLGGIFGQFIKSPQGSSEAAAVEETKSSGS